MSTLTLRNSSLTSWVVTVAGELETSGGGRGLAGMERRVAACGGSVAAGPTADGGWRITARLPARSVAAETRRASVA